MEEGVESPGETAKTKRRVSLWLFFLFVLLTATVAGCYYVKQPPHSFPTDTIITIPNGATVAEVAEIMKENHMIKSKLAFYVYFKLFQSDTSLKASDYSFSEPLPLGQLIVELAEGHYTHNLLKLTHVEGESVQSLAIRAKDVLSNFDQDKFIEIALPFEGKVFPETYMVPADFSEEDLLDLTLKTFDEKIKPYETRLADNTLTLDEVLILASIIEREANDEESMRMVSSILQNRLAINMPLQADASIEYILHKPLSELTAEDLKIESPYNTYLNAGLPPTPIGNPGLKAIEAVLFPAETDYLFYITDKEGNFYYAKNFDQHKVNVARYLR